MWCSWLDKKRALPQQSLASSGGGKCGVGHESVLFGMQNRKPGLCLAANP
jgi:hypothetical protein